MMNKKNKLQELIEVLGIRENSVKMRDQMSETILTSTLNRMIDELGKDDDMEEITEEINTFKEIYLQKISSMEEELISCIIALYDKHFSEDEIDLIIDFYTSPTGKKSVELAPVFAKEIMRLSAKHTKQVMREIEEEEGEKEITQSIN